jgi:hypothetical protein
MSEFVDPLFAAMRSDELPFMEGFYQRFVLPQRQRLPWPKRGLAFHYNAHPGLYRVDEDAHQQLLRGEDIEPTWHSEEFKKRVADMTSHGVYMWRLRMLPRPGFHGYTREDVGAFVARTKGPASAGEDCRFAWFDEQAPRLVAACGADSPFVQHYLQGVEQDIPRGSFWLAKQVGSRSIHALSLMSYRENTDHSALYSRTFEWPADGSDCARYGAFALSVFEDPQQSYDAHTILRQIGMA